MPCLPRRVLCVVCVLLVVFCLYPAYPALAAANKSRPAPASDAARQEQVYTGNAKSKKYHNSTCRYYTCKQCTLRFRSAAAARAEGFSPCKICGG